MKDEYVLPKLPYAYDALEPHIDAKTMEIHHTKHHATYLHKLLDVFGNEEPKVPLKKLLLMDDRPAVQNHGGGFYNHSLFWKMMSPKGGGKPTGELLKALEKKWGNYEAFQKEFSDKALTLFGSGWTWLVKCGPELKIIQKPNQNHPDIGTCTPILGLDVWEHAYYLKYQNRRPEYVAAFWNVVNWHFCEEHFTHSHN